MGRKERKDVWRRARLAISPRPRSLELTLLFVPLVLLMLAACGGGDDDAVFTLGNEGVTLQGAATLVCSDPCRDSGQCGTLGNDWVILASSSGPATELHDLTFPADSQVTVLANQMEIVQSVSDPSLEQRMVFYAVESSLGSGWVAGWCIGQEIVP